MSKLIRYALGIVLPPVGVFATYGLGVQLIISILLTLMGWLPGSIHAVWAISKSSDDLEPTEIV